MNVAAQKLSNSEPKKGESGEIIPPPLASVLQKLFHRRGEKCRQATVELKLFDRD